MNVNRSKPDLLFVTLVHQALRADAVRLSDAVDTFEPADLSRRLPGVRAFFDHYCGQLRLHHNHEDNLFFPALLIALGDSTMPVSDLTAQHENLEADLEAISEGFAALAEPAGDFAAIRAGTSDKLRELVAHLGAHLALEEATVLPLLEATLSPASYRQLEVQARRQTPRTRARFLIPWLVSHATPLQQAALFRSAPPLRAVYWVNRRHFRVLDQALAY